MWIPNDSSPCLIVSSGCLADHFVAANGCAHSIAGLFGTTCRGSSELCGKRLDRVLLSDMAAGLTWPMAKRLKLFGITYLVGKISRSNFYFKVHWPSELYLAIGLVYFVASDLTLQETKIASETQGLEVDFPFEGLLTGAILASFCWCTS